MDNNLGLNQTEFAYFTAQAIVCGDWRLLKIEKDRAMQLLSAFFDAYRPGRINPDDFINYIYRTVQNSMLARQTYSFETLQKFPPFSEFGKKNLLQLLKFYQEKGVEAFENGFRRMFRDGWEERKPKQEIVRILSGDGKTIETPVKFSAREIQKRITAEYWFITYNYGKENEDWERGVHYSTSQPKTHKMISNWNITLSDEKTVSVYFDADRD